MTRERVLHAAIDLADLHGLDALSMRRLGEAVGVEAMSLYNHVAGKEDLLTGMADLIFSEIDEPVEDDGDWKSAMRRSARSARDVLERHRWAVGLLDSRTSPGPATLRHFEQVLRCLRTAGFSVEMAVHAYGVIYYYTYGFVLASQRQSHRDQGEQIISAVDPDDYPFSTEIINGYVLQPGFDPSREFNRGLDLILDGLDQALRTPPG